jgi:hypothetical protein
MEAIVERVAGVDAGQASVATVLVGAAHRALGAVMAWRARVEERQTNKAFSQGRIESIGGPMTDLPLWIIPIERLN